MLIPPIPITELMRQSLTGALATDPVVPERTPRRSRRSRRRPARTAAPARTARTAVVRGSC